MVHLTSPRQIFGIDLRTLALFRVSISFLLIIDLLVRLSDLKAHYTDLGVFPRDVVIENAFSSWNFSLHLINGSLPVQALFFVVQLLFAFMLLVGYRTRLASVVSWILFASLNTFNPLVLTGGDDTLRLAMFWGMFLPLGAKFSIDRVLSTNEEKSSNAHVSAGTVALLVQVSMIYLFAFLFKIHPIWIGEYSALYYMFSLDMFANEFAQFLLDFPTLLKFMTAMSVWLELTCAILLWAPVFTTKARLFVILAITSMQIGIASTMGLGTFPFVSIAAVFIFLPSATWDWVAERFRTSSRINLRVYFDNGCDFCCKSVRFLGIFTLIPGMQTIPADKNPKVLRILEEENSWVIVDYKEVVHMRFEALVYIIRQSPIFFPIAWILRIPFVLTIGDKLYRSAANNRTALSNLLKIFSWRHFSTRIPRWQQLLAGFFLVYVVTYNISLYDRFNWKVTEDMRWVTQVQAFASIGIWQNWKLFAPYPMMDDGWYVIPAKLANGKSVDLWREGSPVNFDKPSQVRHDYKNNRWVKYMRNIYLARNAHLRVYFGRYLCREWNSDHYGPEQLRTFSIVYMMERTLPDYAEPEIERLDLWRHDCFAKGPLTA